MDLFVNFIGIILLFKTVSGGVTSFTAYVPDGRSHPAACASFIPEHYAFIRVQGVKLTADKIKWPYIACNDGSECKLFPLDGDDIMMTGVNPGKAPGTTVDATVDILPKYKDYNPDYPIDPSMAKANSVATMTFSAGALSASQYGNGMQYSHLEVSGIGSDITITGSAGRSIVIPKGATVDIINLPVSIALGVPGTQMGGGDRVHYFLYHKLAKGEPKTKCKSPSDTVGQQPMIMGGPVGGEVSLSIACSNSTYP